MNYLELAINGSNVASQYADVDMNSGKPGHMAIDQTVKLLEGKNVLTVAVTDSGKNVTTKKLTVYYEPKKTLAAPTVTPSTTDPAKQVTLTAKAAATGETVQYSADDGKTYQDLPANGLNVTANGTFKFKAVDLYGNESPAVDYVVKNIKTDDPAQLQQAKTALQDLIAKAKTTAATGKYLDTSVTALNSAVATAQTALDQADATIDSLTTATNQLTTALNQLTLKLPADQQDALLNKLQSAKDVLGTTFGGQTNSATGMTFNAELDALTAETKAGTSTADQLDANFNKMLDAALTQLAKTVKDGTPASVGDTKDTTTGLTWYAEIDSALKAGTTATTDTQKIAQLQGLFGLKTKIAAAVEAAKQAGDNGSNSNNGGTTNGGSGSSSNNGGSSGGDTGGDSNNGGATNDGTGNDSNNGGGETPNPGTGKGQTPGDGGGTPSDTKQQPSTPTGDGTQPLGTAGKDDTTPQPPTSTGQGGGTSSHGTNQQASKKDTLPKTAEVTQTAGLAFLGAFITSIVGFLGVNRRRKEH